MIKRNKNTFISKILKTALFICLLQLFFINSFAQTYLIENKGQLSDSILFYSMTKNYSFFVTKDRIHFKNYSNQNEQTLFFKGLVDSIEISYNNFPYFNFFVGNNPNQWIQKARTCNEVRFFKDNRNLFSLKIDNHLALNSQDRIQFSSKEQDKVKILELKPGEQIIFHTPNQSNLKLINNSKHEKTQAINPTFYSSYFGGAGWDVGEDIAVDRFKNIYIVGTTDSQDLPITDSAYQTKLRLGKIKFPDCFVAKFDSTGKNLIFATYIGSQLEDYGKSIAVDDSSNIYITGYLGPTGTFPYTSNAYDTTENGAFDSFVAKLSSDGSQLLASTFLGSSNDDYSLKLVLDKKGNVNICGYTKINDDFPVTTNAIQKYHGGENDVFYCKFSNNLDSLLYSTLLGGLDDDFGEAITIDRNNYIYLAGSTRSLNFPVTSDALDDLYNDTLTNTRRSDGFISIISPDGILDYSTFFGGSNRDVIYDIEVDKNLSFYITGMTESKDFPVTAYAYDTTYRSIEGERNAGDIFISKFLPTRKYLDFSTYIGGSSADKAYNIEIADDSYIYFIGATSSNDINISKNAFQKEFKDSSFGSDALLGIIEPPGDKLIYLSYFGGTASDISYSMELINNELFYFTGTTLSDDFPISISPFSSSFNNDTTSDAFYGILQPKIIAVSAGGDKNGIIQVCKGETITLGSSENIGIRGSATFSWFPTTGLNNPNSPNPTLQVTKEATYIVHAIDSKGWEDWDTVQIKLLPVIDAKIFGPEYVFKSSIHSYGTIKNDFAKFKWICSGGIIISADTLSTINVKWGNDSIGYLILITENDIGCKDTSQKYFVHIGEVFKPKITVLTDSVLCSGEIAILDAGYGYKSYNWSDGKTTRFDTITKAGYYWVFVKDSSNYQAISDTIHIEFLPSPPKPNIYFNYDSTLLIVDIFNMKYQWYHNGIPIPGANSRTYVPEKIGWYKCKIGWDENECTTFSDSIELRFSGIITEKNDKIFNIYPNPSETYLKILSMKNNIENVYNLRIINLLGETLFFKNRWYLNSPIDISNFPNGYYFMEFNYGSEIYKFKIFILR